MQVSVMSSPGPNKVTASGIERFINRKIDVGMHQVRQLKCKGDSINKIEVSAQKTLRAEQQQRIREALKTSFD